MMTGGTCKLTNFDSYLSWYEGLTVADADACHAQFKKWRYEPGNIKNDALDVLERNMFSMLQLDSWASWPPEETKEAKWPAAREKNLKLMQTLKSFSEDFEQPVKVAIWADAYALIYIGNPEKGVAVIDPAKYLEYIPEKDYSDVTIAEMKAGLPCATAISDTNLLPSGHGAELMTVNTAKEALKNHDDALRDLQDEITRTRRYETPELVELKAEVDRLTAEMNAKKESLMEELDKKLEEMEEQRFQLESQIYLLDSQIYTILCYTGETVKFAQLKKGKPASAEEPIVIHQKLRFLDEELGRAASLYYIQWEDMEMFETFLSHHPLALDIFAPNERCIVLIRLSKSGNQVGLDRRFPYMNLLTNYDYFHGTTVGIIIRNGENLYLGWTDESRVHIDDDLIISRIVTEVTPDEQPTFTFDSERKAYIKKQRQEKKTIIDGLVSRSFVYSILQGIVDNTPILPLPKGVKLSSESAYVKYAIADKWLTDTRFNSFNDIVDKANSVVKEGDYILTTKRLVAEQYSPFGGRRADGTWHNVRGRGDANRTRDVHTEDCTIYPVNLVEFDKEDNARHVFVSLKKNGWSRHTGDVSNARANFEVYTDEYINLSNITSVELEWVITNKTLGNWTVRGHKVDFAFAIKYLNHAMEHVREREAEEKKMLDSIDADICTDPDWPLLLRDWKLETGVRKLTHYNATRFVAATKRKKEEG